MRERDSHGTHSDLLDPTNPFLGREGSTWGCSVNTYSKFVRSTFTVKAVGVGTVSGGVSSREKG